MFNNTENEKVTHPSNRTEDVYILDCDFCGSRVCERGMKSFLIADEKVELYSTDDVNRCAVELTDETICTDKCRCLIQNMACLQCGNVVGYHVSMPCQPCIQAQNNGHFWMFYRRCTWPSLRLNREGTTILRWGDLKKFEEDIICDAFWEECER